MGSRAEARLRIRTSSRRGQNASVRLWLELSDEEIASDPQLSLAAVWVFFYGGDAARARRVALG